MALVCIEHKYPYSYVSLSFIVQIYGHLPDLHSFPTRRSSDLADRPRTPRRRSSCSRAGPRWSCAAVAPVHRGRGVEQEVSIDRKSTRLNSSHLVISYAVFCLKKKKKTT